MAKILLIIFPIFLTYALTDEQNNIQIYEKSAPSVVHITSLRTAHSFSFGEQTIPRGSGSGIVWNSEGYVVTNFHVVNAGDSFHISFYKDKNTYLAKVIGVAPQKDIAVLKLSKFPKKLNPVSVAVSNDLQVGQKVLAIGNPFGFDYTMTTGIVSALGRKIDGPAQGIKIHNMIQTDASINPGNSGGPLLDSKGALIGMNTLIIGPSGASAGVGFAVPSDTLSRIVPQLIKHGRIIRPALGISILQNRIKANFGVKKGVVIMNVLPGGPAESAGLLGLSQDPWGRVFLGDVILKIASHNVNSLDDIYHVLSKFKIGQNVDVTVKRKEKQETFKVKLTKGYVD